MAEPGKGIKNSEQKILTFAAYATRCWTTKTETARGARCPIS